MEGVVMFNLFGGEFYKWKKSRSFKICTVIAVAVVVWLYLMIAVASHLAGEPLTNPEGEIPTVLEMVGEVNSTGVGTIFMAIFICIWVVGEYSHGAIKNIAGKGLTREQVFLSKYFSSVAATMVMNLIYFAAIVIVGCIYLGTDSIGSGFFRDLSAYIGLQLFFGVAVSGIIVAICEFTRNMAVGISISLCILLLSDVLLMGLDLLLSAAKLDIKASTYWIINVIKDCPTIGLTTDFLGRAISVMVMWTAISLVLGMVHFKRTDVV